MVDRVPLALLIKPNSTSRLRLLVEEQSRQNVGRCFQCGKCTAGCPVSYSMDLTPRQIMRALQLGLDDEVRKSSSMWLCISCMICSARCPREIDVAGIMETLRLVLDGEGLSREQRDIRVFHELLLRFVRLSGRVYEAGLALSYNLASMRPFNKVDILPGMVFRGKLSFLPHSSKGVSKIRRLFTDLEQLRRQPTRGVSGKDS